MESAKKFLDCDASYVENKQRENHKSDYPNTENISIVRKHLLIRWLRIIDYRVIMILIDKISRFWMLRIIITSDNIGDYLIFSDITEKMHINRQIMRPQ